MNTNPQPVAKQPPAATPQPSTTEYSIRIMKDTKKKHHVMRFNGNLKVDFKDWKGKSVKMERENNMKSFKELDEEIPKFGAGSEFGREAREEARRKRYGITSKQYKPEDQPWLLKIDGKNGKKYKGTREGGVSENAAYYIFTHGANGVIEAFPLKEWYNFKPIQTYKALSAEEAEEEFNRRNKVMDYFSLMMRKRLRNDEDIGEDVDREGEKGKKPGKKNKDFKISEMDDWVDDDEDDNSDSDKEDDSGDDNNKKKKKKGALKKKKKRASDSEAFEESDDGDEEGRECDYISDSSASESELESQKEMKSVAEEDALRKLLASDEEEDEEEEKKDDEDKNEEDDEEGKEKDEKEKDKPNKDKSKDKNKEKSKDKKKKDGSDSSSEGEIASSQNKDEKKPTSTQSSRSVTPTAATDSLKRPAPSTSEVPPVKKTKLETNYALPSTSSSGDSRTITEEAVRRYLMRKPMTARELCQKFKRKSGLSSEQLVEMMTKVLRNINPTSQRIKEKTYFSIKVDPKQQQPHNN